MKPILQNDTIQIEITNACTKSCSNCTRFVGHHKKPFFMRYDQFVEAVESLLEFPKMTGPGPKIGVMGGEPLIHPEFKKFCKYLHSKVPREYTGLWTTFPEGYEDYRGIIAETFGNIFLNDHTRGDIMHKPILVGAEELPLNEWQRWYMIDQCFFQRAWSASINPNGAFFCEIAASMSMLLDKTHTANGKRIGWKVEPGWWTRSPLLYHDQIREFCSICGLAMPVKMRSSTDLVDDVSPAWVERLKDKSPRVKAGKYVLHDLKLSQDQRPLAKYKEVDYRQQIAARYGMTLSVTPQCFPEPHLIPNWKKGDRVDIYKPLSSCVKISPEGALSVVK